MARRTSIASSTVRVMGPSLSRDQQSVIAPVRGTRPKVGRRPVTPQRIEGLTMLPPVSLPIENATKAAAVAAPGPALDPDVVEGQCTKRELRQHYRASIVKPANDSRISRRYTVPKWLGSICRWYVFGIKQIFDAVRN